MFTFPNFHQTHHQILAATQLMSLPIPMFQVYLMMGGNIETRKTLGLMKARVGKTKMTRMEQFLGLTSVQVMTGMREKNHIGTGKILKVILRFSREIIDGVEEINEKIPGILIKGKAFMRLRWYVEPQLL
jgi:hypothetical protein